MPRLLKVLVAFLIILAVPLAPLAIALSYNSPCGVAPAPAGSGELMKAVVHRCYGSPEVLRLEDIEKPSAGSDAVLVRVHAASLNAHDWHTVRGTPYMIRLLTGFGTPHDVRTVATDFAGTIEAVGKDVQRFKVGDEVFGWSDDAHALAQYLTVRESGAIAKKPAAVTFEEAAAVPVSGVTALQALRDLGHIRAGEKVLINGASGGVGTFAVQLAKLFGAEVTAVCSTRNLEMVRSLGADHLIDYTKEDFTEGAVRYELILDLAGNRSVVDYWGVLAPQGTLALIGVTPGDWIGPLVLPVQATVLGYFARQKFLSMFAHIDADDLQRLAELMQSGRLRSVIDRRYALAEAPAAMAYVEAGHARGKVAIDVE